MNVSRVCFGELKTIQQLPHSRLPIIYSLTLFTRNFPLSLEHCVVVFVVVDIDVQNKINNSWVTACMLIFMAPPLWLCYLLWCIYQVKPRLVNLQSSLIFIDLSHYTSVLNKLLVLSWRRRRVYVSLTQEWPLELRKMNDCCSCWNYFYIFFVNDQVMPMNKNTFCLICAVKALGLFLKKRKNLWIFAPFNNFLLDLNETQKKACLPDIS